MEEYGDGGLVLRIYDRDVLEKGENTVDGAVYGLIVVFGVVLVVGSGTFDYRLWDRGTELLGARVGCYIVCLTTLVVRCRCFLISRRGPSYKILLQ
jgi:hypothetical protein